MHQKKPIFSICICNRNMASTIEICISSILGQIDERFEIVIIDDGSSDNSLSILQRYDESDSRVKLVALPSDRNRKLGFTRNISIAEASGEWVILHLDTDDRIDEGLIEFVESVLLINSIDTQPVLYSGHQIHMAPRDWLLGFGPYRNLYRLEDRDLYQRLIPKREWRIIDHEKFIHRLPRDRNDNLKKTIKDAYEHLVSDTRYEQKFHKALKKEVARLYPDKPRLKLFRLVLLPFAFFAGRRLGVIDTMNGDFSNQGVNLYRQQNTRTAEEWCRLLAANQ